MNNLVEWFNKVTTEYTIAEFFQKWVWYDWLTLTFVLVGIIYGIRRGFLRELVEILETLLVLCIVMGYYKKVAALIQTRIPKIPYEAAPCVAFILTAFIVGFVILVVDMNLKKLIHAQTPAFIKYFGGAAIGFFHFLIIWSLLSQPMALMPAWSVKKVFEVGNSYTGPRIVKMAPFIHELVSLSIEYVREPKNRQSGQDKAAP